MLSASLRISSADTDGIISSLKPEAGRDLPRTRIRIFDDNGTVAVDISATDTSAMRAALNSYLECIKITEDINRITR